MTLKFSGFLAAVRLHLHANFNRAKFRGSWVIVRTEKKTPTKTILSVASAYRKYSDNADARKLDRINVLALVTG